MIVNGKVWPKVTLSNKKYRFIFLNSCQSRYLNIYFENNGRRIDFEIIRRDSDFLKRPVKLQEHLLFLASRIEIVIDLSQLVGEVILKNNANAPYPMGTAPD
jgi:FtsP/CotA-like multicopper oxidase with cupredoxin domain